jgi:hypothetical protein
MPRQMYGLGSFVKSIGKGIKKIVKSPIGKAAILGFGANALMPGGLSSLFSGGGGLTGLFTKAKGLYDGLSGVQKLGGALALGGAFGGMEDQQIEELKANPEALANYLRQYYSNLNQDATPTQVEEFVQRNMQANGGRIGYDDGTPDPTYTGNNKEDLPRGLQIDTTTSNPMPKEKSLKENLEFVEETKGGVSPSTTMYMFKMYLDEALEKGQITKEKYNKMLMPLFGKTGEGVTRDYERYEQSMAYGGRIKRAYGSDELVEQASGIEGLDININPKGVKELDLRETGGFIPPVGVKEKADDIPAMLSNNEFVFTADAVRAAGGGSVNKGAQIMYDTMKKLENGGTV